MMKTNARMILLLTACASLAACSGGTRRVPPGMGPELTSRGVLFRYVNPDAKSVHIVGDFNNWSPKSDPMTDEDGDGVWTLTYPMSPGRYAYKLIVDGRNWIPDPSNPVTEPDGFDGLNSIVTVPGSDGSR